MEGSALDRPAVFPTMKATVSQELVREGVLMAFVMILGALVLWGGGVVGLMQVGPPILVAYNTPLWIGGAVLFVVGIALSRGRRNRNTLDRARVRVDIDMKRK